MNNTKLAGGLAAAIIGIPVAVGLFGGGEGKDDSHGQKDTTTEQSAAKDPTAGGAEAETSGSEEKTELASTDSKTDEGESAEAATSESESETAATDDKTDEGESAETTSSDSETETASTDTAESETAEGSESVTAATDDKTDEGESTETETAAVTYTPPPPTEPKAEDTTATDDKTDEGESAETETAAVTYTPPPPTEPKAEDTATSDDKTDEGESAETETAAVTYTPPPPTEPKAEDTAAADDKTDEGESAETETAAVTYTPPPRSEPKEDAQFEDTTGATASASGGAIQLAMNSASEPTASTEQEAVSPATSGGREISGFDGLTTGSAYDDARTALVKAGWSPRELTDADRLDPLEGKEISFVQEGYAELEGCETYARTICRFEFLNDTGKIAAVLTSGVEDTPMVIDAYIMDVK